MQSYSINVHGTFPLRFSCENSAESIYSDLRRGAKISFLDEQVLALKTLIS
jgi:hypothetical protein